MMMLASNEDIDQCSNKVLNTFHWNPLFGTQWSDKGICNTLQNSTTWFTSCTHHSLGCRKWHWKYHKRNCCFSSYIWWKKKNLYNPLYKIVLKKQLHTCENRSIINKYRNQCKYGFSFNTQPDWQFKFNNYINHWEYYRPKYEDRNVVLYHASLFF